MTLDKKKRSLNEQTSLPRPTVEYPMNPAHPTEATMRGVLCNPIYVGIPPFSRRVSNEAWIKAAVELIKEEGIEQFLVNMLYVLRLSMVDVAPLQSIPFAYDGPWPDDADAEFSLGEQEEEVEMTMCSHDGLPMIPVLGEGMVCVGAYLLAHLRDAQITDLLTDPFLTLVFQNGHTLPLLCPECSESLHIESENELLEQITGLSVVSVEWNSGEEHDESAALLLIVGKSGDESTYHTLPIHLASVFGLTCPESRVWHEGD
ncbi:MAG: hypothetical protein KJ077_26030 [Anaerolineae bacterium]|nr:hypothetical protein [Anaerolineae bacterium]